MPFPNPSFSNNDLSNPNNRQTPGIQSYMPRQNPGNIGFNGIPGAANYQPQTQVIGRPGFELGGVPILQAQQQQVPGAGVSTLAPNMGNASSTILPTDPNNPPTRPGFVNNKGPAPDLGLMDSRLSQMAGNSKNPSMQQPQMPQNGGKNPQQPGARTLPVQPPRI